MRREQQATERRRQILAAALEVFAARGYDGASVKELAAAAGMAPGLLYHYFAGKEDLLAQVIETHSLLPALREVLPVAADRPAREVLTELVSRGDSLLSERASLVRLIVQEAHRQPAVARAWARVVDEAFDLVAAYVAQRAAAGELRPHQAHVTVRALLGALLLTHLRAEQAVDWVPDLVEVILEGVRAR